VRSKDENDEKPVTELTRTDNNDDKLTKVNFNFLTKVLKRIYVKD